MRIQQFVKQTNRHILKKYNNFILKSFHNTVDKLWENIIVTENIAVNKWSEVHVNYHTLPVLKVENALQLSHHGCGKFWKL